MARLPRLIGRGRALIRGREDIVFGAEFDASAGATKLPADVVKYYVDQLTDPGHPARS